MKLEEQEEATRKKRDVIDFNKDDDEMVDSEEKCRVDMWRCLSSVIEGGLHYIDNPEGLYGYVSYSRPCPESPDTKSRGLKSHGYHIPRTPDTDSKSTLGQTISHTFYQALVLTL